MFEAVEYRIDALVKDEVRLYRLIPEAEYRSIRIYVSDLVKLRLLLDRDDYEVAYVSFIGKHRPDLMAEVEKMDCALIRSSPASSPILGYFSLQDPQHAWINLVIFDDLESVARWVRETHHADDWERAASYFHSIDKSLGTLCYRAGAVTLRPSQVIVRNYDAA